MTLTKQELLNRVAKSLELAGARMYVTDEGHPQHVIILDGLGSLPACIYIWNVTHGGGAARSAGEQRIQITGVTLPLAGRPGEQVAILGYKEDLDVFVAFDPEVHRSPSWSSPSLQFPEAALVEAAGNGVRTHRRGNNEVAVAVRPELLLAYFRHQQAIHQRLVASDADLRELEAAGGDDGQEEPPGDDELGGYTRAEVLHAFRSYQRDHSFRSRVLKAYERRCAACGLELELIEAAHIVPVGDRDSSDETRNGIALCSLHHEAYDRGVLGIAPDRSILLRAKRLHELEQGGLLGGLEGFRADLMSQAATPREATDRPSAALLRRGLETRGWSASEWGAT